MLTSSSPILDVAGRRCGVGVLRGFGERVAGLNGEQRS
jgi:hypothetical protein